MCAVSSSSISVILIQTSFTSLGIEKRIQQQIKTVTTTTMIEDNLLILFMLLLLWLLWLLLLYSNVSLFSANTGYLFKG